MILKFIYRDELATYNDETKELTFSLDLDRTLIYESKEDAKKFVEWILACERHQPGSYYTSLGIVTSYQPYDVSMY